MTGTRIKRCCLVKQSRVRVRVRVCVLGMLWLAVTTSPQLIFAERVD